MAEAQSFSIDVRNLPIVRNRVKNISRDFGVPMKFLIQDQGRLWLIDLIKKIGNDPTLSIAAQKRQAKERIANDINRIFYPSDDPPFDNMESFHKSRRSKGGGVRYIRAGEKKGRNTKRAIENFIKKQQDEIGKAKAGFIEPLDRLMRETNGGDGGVPKWVRKQESKIEKGTYRDGMTAIGDGDIVCRNNVPYANDIMNKGTFFATARTRQRDLVSQATKRKDRIIKQFNGLNA